MVGWVNADQGLLDARALPQELHTEQYRAGGQPASAPDRIQAESQVRLIRTGVGLA